MKLACAVLVACLGIQAAATAESNLTLTAEGLTFSNVTFGTVTPATVTIFHSTGIALLPLAKLAPKLQKQFGYDPVKAEQYLQVEQAQRRKLAAAEAVASAANVGKRVMLCGRVIQALETSALVEASTMEPFTDENGSKLGKYSVLGTVMVTGVIVHEDDLAHWICFQGKDAIYTDANGASRKTRSFSFVDVAECLPAFASPEQPATEAK